jgi:hypothetical protein
MKTLFFSKPTYVNVVGGTLFRNGQPIFDVDGVYGPLIGDYQTSDTAVVSVTSPDENRAITSVFTGDKGLVDITGRPVIAEDGPFIYFRSSGYDDSVKFQQLLDDASASSTPLRRAQIVLGHQEDVMIRGAFLRPNIKLDLNGSRIKKTSRLLGNEFTSSEVAVLRTPWQKVNGSWYGQADNITVSNGVLDTNNCDNRGAIELHGVRNFTSDNLTLVTSQWAQAWALRGGGYAFFNNLVIRGQARLYQDGFHWQYGGVIATVDAHAGDDGIAIGDDAGNANVMMDDVGIEYANINGVVKAVRGAALKVYSPGTRPYSGAPNNYVNTGKVRGVVVNVSGKSGILRNGGVSVFSHKAAGSRIPGDLQDIDCTANITVGYDETAVWDAVPGTVVGSPTAVNKSTSAQVSLAGHGLPAGQVVTFRLPPGSMNTLNGFYQVRSTNLAADTFELSDYAYRNNVGLVTSTAPTWTTGELIKVGSGTGYAVDDVLTLSGGTALRPASFQVTEVGPAGEVLAIRRLDEGLYSVLPPVANTPTGGTGTGAVLQLYTQHDGVNAFGVKIVGASGVTVKGEIDIYDTKTTAARFKTFWITDSDTVRLHTNFPKVTANGGLVTNEGSVQLSRDVRILSHMVCPDNLVLDAGYNPIMVSNTDQCVISGSIDNLPANASAVAFPIGGNIIGSRAIVSITGASNSTFACSHGGWKAGQVVRISGNVLSTGSLDGYYIIRSVPDNSTLQLKNLPSGTTSGSQVGLGALTVVTPGTIELANNHVVIRDFNVSVKPNTTGHVGVNQAASTPHRVSSLVVENSNLSACGAPIGSLLLSLPVRAVFNNVTV